MFCSVSSFSATALRFSGCRRPSRNDISVTGSVFDLRQKIKLQRERGAAEPMQCRTPSSVGLRPA
jgi:hypothetical protein